MTHRLVFALFALALFAMPVRAQYSSTGLSFRPHLSGAAWGIEEIDETGHSGGGLGLAAAYGLSERFAAIARFSGARLETEEGAGYTLAHFDIGVQATMTDPGSRLKVQLEAEASARTARFEVLGANVDLNGKGLTLGFGMMYFMSNSVALDGGLLATFGTIDEISGGGATLDLDDVKATSTRLNFGLTWFVGN